MTRANHVCFRALCGLFAPYAPVEILVPEERAQEAERRLGRLLLPD